MGRKLSGEPYRYKVDGKEIGSYRLNLGGGRQVSLQTRDYEEAKRKADVLLNRQAENAGNPATPIVSVDATPIVQPPQSQSPTKPEDILSKWIEAKSANGNSAPITPEIPTAGNPQTTTPQVTAVTPVRHRGLSPEQAEKLSRGLRKVLTKINLIAGAYVVSIAGREPAKLEEDEVELLVLGWELMLEEYFVKTKPKPWMVLVAGNVMMLFSMYLRGKPVIKEVEEQQELPVAS